MPTGMDLDRDKVIDQLAVVASPCTGHSCLWGLSVVPLLMGLIHLFRILQVPPCLPAFWGAMAVMVGLSSSIPEGMEPLPKKAHLGSFLRVSSQYACGVTCCLCGSCFFRLLH
jgi:hypothetical protein